MPLKFDENKYGIIDSYINPVTNNPQVLDYIQEHNISPEYIDFVLLTHGHQDHYRGISQILDICKNARFFTSSSFKLKSFQFLLSAYIQVESKNNFFNEFIDIFNILKNTDRDLNVLSDKGNPIFNANGIKIFAISPNTHTDEYLDKIYRKEADKHLNRNNEKFALGHDFNFQSVVLVVQIGELQILYGADLEYHETNINIGWASICQDIDFQKHQFDLFKVPHHGSETSCNETDWTAFLKENRVLKLTPYSRGKKLPDEKMVRKIKTICCNSYITSDLSKKYKKYPLHRKLRKGHKKLSYSHGEINVTSNKKGKLQVTLSGNAVPLSKL